MSQIVSLPSRWNLCANQQNPVLFAKSHYVTTYPKHFNIKLTSIFEYETLLRSSTKPEIENHNPKLAQWILNWGPVETRWNTVEKGGEQSGDQSGDKWRKAENKGGNKPRIKSGKGETERQKSET
jgi:hypothetical protein